MNAQRRDDCLRLASGRLAVDGDLHLGESARAAAGGVAQAR